MNSEIVVRPVIPADADRLLAIYAPYVLESAITFEYEVPSLQEFEKRITHITSCYPYLAALAEGEIKGYAYASAFKNRPAYDWSVETSIYVDKDYHGQGIGSKLYRRLEELLRRQNICNLCACIAYPNPESIGFHEHMGYKTVAHFHQSGYKFGSWYDMIWMEKFINPHLPDPKPFIPIKEVL